MTRITGRFRIARLPQLLLASSFLAGLLLAAPAMAVEIPPEKRKPCEEYQAAWDKAGWKRQNRPEFNRALELRRSGEVLCNTGRKMLGQETLKKALNALNIPVPKP